jgi:hypothetical protein
MEPPIWVNAATRSRVSINPTHWREWDPKGDEAGVRYYFDLQDAHGLFPDKEGTELATFAAAQEEAALSFAGMARDAAQKVHRDVPHAMAIEVRDENGPVLRIRFTVEVNPIVAATVASASPG